MIGIATLPSCRSRSVLDHLALADPAFWIGHRSPLPKVDFSSEKPTLNRSVKSYSYTHSCL